MGVNTHTYTHGERGRDKSAPMSSQPQQSGTTSSLIFRIKAIDFSKKFHNVNICSTWSNTLNIHEGTNQHVTVLVCRPLRKYIDYQYNQQNPANFYLHIYFNLKVTLSLFPVFLRIWRVWETHSWRCWAAVPVPEFGCVKGAEPYAQRSPETRCCFLIHDSVVKEETATTSEFTAWQEKAMKRLL